MSTLFMSPGITQFARHSERRGNGGAGARQERAGDLIAFGGQRPELVHDPATTRIAEVYAVLRSRFGMRFLSIGA
jgi:hypothetical protein